VTAPRAALFRGIGVAIIAIAYAVLAHESNVAPGGRAIGVVLAVGPLLILAVVLTWHTKYRIPCLLLCTFACFLVVRYWSLLIERFAWIYLAQQTSAYVVLGAMFGRSLVRGRTPLCTHWATVVHGPLPPAVARYTRSVTSAWTLFFALMTLVLIALFVFAPIQVWSAFANFCAFPLIVAMFVAEYIVRGRVLPDMRHAGILEGARAFLDFPRDAGAPRR
jgi:uncharacterized membrane protein